MECTSRGWEYPGMSEELGRGKGNPHEVTIGVLGLFRGIIGGNPGSTKCIPRGSSSASLSPLAPRAPNSARGRAKKKPRPGEGLGLGRFPPRFQGGPPWLIKRSDRSRHRHLPASSFPAGPGRWPISCEACSGSRPADSGPPRHIPASTWQPDLRISRGPRR